MPQKTELTVEGKRLPVSNLNKVLYPAVGFTKGHLIDYYIKVSPFLLPHLKNRPLTLKRYPEGVEGFFFYEKQCPAHRPTWIKTTKVPRQSKESEQGEINYCVINSLSALVWVANLADIELHTFLHRAPAIDRPTMVGFDLDPGAPADILLCCQVALWLKEHLEQWHLQAFAKTSGFKGLQLYVPINTPVSYDQTKEFAHQLALRLEREHPVHVVSQMNKSLRKGKVFVDWSQNDDHKTTVCVYSLRAMEYPTVSTPVTWEEITDAVKSGSKLAFEPEEVLERIDRHGDLFEPTLHLKQRLPK